MAEIPANSSLPFESPRRVGRSTPDQGPARGGDSGSDRWMDMFKTFATVTTLTILIWIYAEREQARTQPDVSIPIEVRATDGTRLISLRAPADGNVTATLSGPRTVVDSVLMDLRSRSPDHAAVQLYIDTSKLPRGESSLETARYIASNSLFTRQGISVSVISPPTLRIDIDDFETRSLEVKAPPNIPNVQEVTFFPSTVTVKGPGRVFKNAEASKLFVVADFSKLGVIDKPGRHVVPGVGVTIMFKGEAVTIEPQTVTATFEIKKAEVEMELESIAIFTSAPIPITNGYQVECKPLTIPRIHVAGPQDQIDLLKNNEFKPKAILELLPEDTDQSVKHRKPVHFVLPKDVRVVSEPESYTVDFTLMPKPKE